MKTIIYFTFILTVIYNSVIAQQYIHLCSKAKSINRVERNSFLKTNYPGDSNIDVKHYKLDINVNHTMKLITGTVDITSLCLSENLTNIYFDLGNILQVSEVRYNYVKTDFRHEDNKVILTPPSSLNQNEQFTVSIDYSGSPTGSGFGSFNFSSQNGSPLIWTLSQPYGASDWWPCKDTPSDKADSADIWITCASELIPVSNGTLIDIVDSGRLHTYKWKSSYPIAHYLISIAITNYHLYENYFIYNNGQDTLSLTHYNYPANFSEQRKVQLDETVKMMEVFSELFGEYPFIREKYGHAEMSRSGGMEHQTISSMGGFFSDLIAHELAHQWFGDKITCRDWHNIWLNEGFATYSEALYREAISGKEVYNNTIINEMNYAKNAIGTLYVEDISTVGSIFNYSKSYAKGAVVLHMLRGVLGDDTFFKMLYNYINEENLVYSTAVTEDFQEVAESVSGVDLDYFFNQWVYGENYPTYFVSWKNRQTSGNTYNLQVDISQAINSYPAFFTMPVDLHVYTSAGDTTINIWNDKVNQIIDLNVTGTPLDVVLDPSNKILKEVIYFREQLIPAKYSVKQNYPNPFNSSTKIIYSLPGRSDVNISIFSTNGELLSSEINKDVAAGQHIYNLDMSGLELGNIRPASGIYFYKFTTNSGSITKKMVFLK